MKKDKFLKGIKDGIPIGLGYLSVSFAFGIFAVESGLDAWQTLLISMLNVTSAGQLAGVPIIVSHGSLMAMAVSQLVINARYALMSVSLSQKLSKSVSFADRFLISFVNTDEVFAVASSKNGLVGKSYLYGLILTPYLGWSTGTLIGACAGNILPASVISALGIAIYGMFVAIVVPVVKEDKKTLACVIVAIMLSCVINYVPVLKRVLSDFSIIICAVIASLLFAIIAPIEQKEVEDNE